MLFSKSKARMPEPNQVLPGRQESMPVPSAHFVNGHPLVPPFPDGLAMAVFGLGCFWGAERKFWETPGVYTTAVGYAGGTTPNPTYEEVCSGRTGHTEAVLVVYDPDGRQLRPAAEGVLGEPQPDAGHAPGQRHRYAVPVRHLLGRRRTAGRGRWRRSRLYQEHLRQAGYGEITTEVAPAGPFYYAEPYHQQYLGKNPNGYCGLGGTGVSCPVGLAKAE